MNINKLRDINIVYSQDFLDSPRKSPFGETQRAQELLREENRSTTTRKKAS